jgi:hypothetical protein
MFDEKQNVNISLRLRCRLVELTSMWKISGYKCGSEIKILCEWFRILRQGHEGPPHNLISMFNQPRGSLDNTGGLYTSKYIYTSVHVSDQE